MKLEPKRAHVGPGGEAVSNIYVAGGSSERVTVVRPLMARLIERGWTVTHDWTQDPGYDLDRPLTDEERAGVAERDLRAVDKADVVWLVVPAGKSEGASVEFGYACGSGKVVIVSGPDATRCPLWAYALRQFLAHEDALEWLGRAGRGDFAKPHGAPTRDVPPSRRMEHER